MELSLRATNPLTVLLCSLALAVCISGRPAEASPGRTLVIHNNTNATLLVSKGGGPDIEVPPLTKKSLFNFLDRGQNQVIIGPKYNLGIRDISRQIRVTGQERSVNALEFFPRDFGKTAMFDPPPPRPDPGPESPVHGVWAWFVNGDVTFHPNGTMVQGSRRGTWVKYGNGVTLQWSHGYTDVLYLTPDNRKMQGQGYRNDDPGNKYKVWGVKK